MSKHVKAMPENIRVNESLTDYVLRMLEERDELQAENERLKSEQSERGKLLAALSDISSMCVGEVAMGARLDAEYIGQLIYSATGLTQPELAKLTAEDIE